ncbi:MAG: hypothetical protein Q3962_07365 [Corynebacterium sp.]|nr:hypothetical protein [Corynebacterium sp.]
MQPVIFRRVATAVFLVLLIILAIVTVPRWRLEATVAHQFSNAALVDANASGAEGDSSSATAAGEEVTVLYKNRMLPYLGMLSSSSKDMKVRIKNTVPGEKATSTVELGLSNVKVKKSRIESADVADVSVALDEESVKLLAMKAASNYVERMDQQNKFTLRGWRDYTNFTKLREAIEAWFSERGGEIGDVDFNQAEQSITIALKNGTSWTLKPKVVDGHIEYERSGGSNWLARMMRQTLDEGLSEEIIAEMQKSTAGGLENPEFDSFEVTKDSFVLHFHKQDISFTGGPVFLLK